MSSAVGAYVAQVDRLLAGGVGLFPGGGSGVGSVAGGVLGAPSSTPGVSGLSVGAGGAGVDYRGSWSRVGGLDGDVDAVAAAGRAVGEQGRAGAVRVRESAQLAAGVLGPGAARSPAGMRVLVSAMDERLAAMQRQVETTRGENGRLAERFGHLAHGYRSIAETTEFGRASTARTDYGPQDRPPPSTPNATGDPFAPLLGPPRPTGPIVWCLRPEGVFGNYRCTVLYPDLSIGNFWSPNDVSGGSLP